MSVIQQAKYFASILEADPILAAQVKEHIKPERLFELLDIDPVSERTVSDPEALSDASLICMIEERWAGLTPAHQKRIRDVSFPFKK